MGANASTAVPVYASGEVLDASRLNLTNSGIPVFSGTATRDAAFGGSGEKVLAEGQVVYLEDTDALQYYSGTSFVPVGGSSGLTLISATTVGTTVASVTVSSAFSATYDNYRVIYTGGVASTAVDLGITLGATTANYYFSFGYIPYGGAMQVVTVNNGASWAYAGGANTALTFISCDIFRPFAADETLITSNGANASNGNFGGGYLNNTTSYTAFTITPSSGTITGGTIRVYGYQNS
jgi:hypothetical protein